MEFKLGEGGMFMFGLVIGLCVASVITWMICDANAVEPLRAEAVRRGHAEYHIPEGRRISEWRWKESK